MWTAVYMATGLDNAYEVERKLKAEGFLVKIKYFAQEGEEELYEILAPEFEAEDIQNAMIELGII
ncbi:hypothetical protein SAMN02745784_01276 [Tissierella praeacuta DSM 18095]|uniref:Sporulation related domain-containing protein n=1 Tax=Tissierella praeacuta DSM 18095 TaxID=1123404 RepID=A0A1M4UZS4_9FIRM|nr:MULTISPECIES: hypothetical protein [Tissierella]TCU74006.1 hypothetical protein EV204_10438 [Tissierella praeacuta]SHE62182.1 hypothetical protein SAMN02745784_01276 [Tissierella praeacuta DSM 18095]SUP02736.1 Uncharacterised protein [Tissierella praeacuta]HAE91541.1 hypothetical protein [Tissierella sp.]